MCNSAAACKPCDHVRVAAVADALRLSNVASVQRRYQRCGVCQLVCLYFFALFRASASNERLLPAVKKLVSVSLAPDKSTTAVVSQTH